MLLEPRCFTRKCVRYIGVHQPDGTEETERNICSAFSRLIPYGIAYGKDGCPFYQPPKRRNKP